MKAEAGILVLLAGTLTASAMSGCRNTRSSEDSRQRAAAQKISDSFISDLIAGRFDDALSRMEPQLVKASELANAEVQLRKLRDYCGQPLQSQLQYDDLAPKTYDDGRRTLMRRFYYGMTTTQYPKGGCFFQVEVVPDEGFKVTAFGPWKLQPGQRPPWVPR